MKRKPSPLVGKQGKNASFKLSPDTGKVSAELTKGASVSRNGRMETSVGKTHKNDFNLCTHTCPYRLANSALPSNFLGGLTLEKKEIKVYHFICAFFLIFLAGVFVDIRTPF